VACGRRFHLPALFAKQAANIASLRRRPLAGNVVLLPGVSSNQMYGVDFERTMIERLTSNGSMWLRACSQKTYNHTGKYTTHKPVLEPTAVAHCPAADLCRRRNRVCE